MPGKKRRYGEVRWGRHRKPFHNRFLSLRFRSNAKHVLLRCPVGSGWLTSTTPDCSVCTKQQLGNSFWPSYHHRENGFGRNLAHMSTSKCFPLSHSSILVQNTRTKHTVSNRLQESLMSAPASIKAPSTSGEAWSQNKAKWIPWYFYHRHRVS